MKRRLWTLGLGAASLLATMPLPALAQRERGDGDDGEFVILQARYGTEQNHVDVTDRLRELARQDRRVRLTNDLFGIDPDPGRKKTLRLFTRDRAGAERSFDFREGSDIDGAQFIGWGGGRWGEPDWNGGWQGRRPPRADARDDGEFTIQYATYGTSRRQADVTAALRELARRDQRFRTGNDSFGVDPDPGRKKLLHIVARDRRGQERSFEYAEGAWVDGAQFVGWSRGDWGPERGGSLVIDEARYGADRRWVDVTQALRAQVRGDRFETEVRNELFGADPAPGQRKMLMVTYRLGRAQPTTVSVAERDTLRLP